MHLTTLEVAAWGAATGTVALLLSGWQRRDSMWLKRAKGTEETRNSLKQLRDAITVAKQGNPADASTPRVTANLEVLEEHAQKSGDWTLRRLLRRAHSSCATASTMATGGAYAQQHAFDQGLKAINEAIDRLDKIDRRSPGSG